MPSRFPWCMMLARRLAALAVLKACVSLGANHTTSQWAAALLRFGPQINEQEKHPTTSNFHLVKTPGNNHISSSDKIRLKPTRENQNIFLSKWKVTSAGLPGCWLMALSARRTSFLSSSNTGSILAFWEGKAPIWVVKIKPPNDRGF